MKILCFICRHRKIFPLRGSDESPVRGFMSRKEFLLFIPVLEAGYMFLTLLIVQKLCFQVIRPVAQKMVASMARKFAILKRSRGNYPL